MNGGVGDLRREPRFAGAGKAGASINARALQETLEVETETTRMRFFGSHRQLQVYLCIHFKMKVASSEVETETTRMRFFGSHRQLQVYLCIHFKMKVASSARC
mmetsp:Transcript_20439/g.29664  ORF Transcript_20439/g.29664 Transcript_20439/m.29664 type:complete len:103 (-) Transcript_20439:1741-2049(-)